jgi:hypothetical protein
VVKRPLIADVVEQMPPEWLSATLSRGGRLALMSEKARSEFLVAPMLLAVRELTADRVAIYSGQRLDVSQELGLVGECDFLLALGQPVPFLHSPLAAIVEAKKHDIDLGIAQCSAQMIAAHRLNCREAREVANVFGCVTTGEIWQFLTLDEQLVVIDQNRYYLDNPGRILGVFVTLIGNLKVSQVA